MHANTAIAFLAPFLAIAQAGLILDSDGISSTCKTICEPMLTLTSKCASNKVGAVNDDAKVDKVDATCICPNTSFDVEEIAGLCASCMAQNHTASDSEDDQEQDSLNDGTSVINSIMSTCSFSSVTYAPASTTAVSGISVSASPTNITDGMKNSSSTKATATATATGTAASATDSSSSSSSSKNAAGMPTPCPAVGVAAAAIAGAVGMMM